MEQRNCTRCNGLGNVNDILGKRTCRACEGRGWFDYPDERYIRLCITASQGKNKGKLRSTRPETNAGSRAYFVWRMARFHGGKDPTVPFNASMEIYGDPFEKELDAMSERFAKENFGTDMGAAIRWGRAFGMI